MFAVGAGATNSGTASSTTTFTVTMNGNHTIAGIFDGTLNPHAGKAAISGSGVLTLTNGLDAFSLGTNGLQNGVPIVDNSVGMVTVGVQMTGLGTMVNEGNGGTLFLTASNSYSGGTILGFSNAPFNGTVTFNSDGIGGPSAGLMWTLGLSDLLTPGDLTGGRTIAGTGTIALDGSVGPIGGIAQKVVAAERAGAKVFFAPTSEAADARAVVHGMAVVPVKTIQDALNWLYQHGGS